MLQGCPDDLAAVHNNGDRLRAAGGGRLRCIGVGGIPQRMRPVVHAVIHHVADADHVKVLVEHVAPVSLAGIVFVGFLPGGKRFPRRVLPGRDVFPYGGVAARRERGETAVPIRSRVVKVHRDFRRALHGDLLQRVIIGQRAEVVYIDFRAVLIPHPCVAAGAELVDVRQHLPRALLLVRHLDVHRTAMVSAARAEAGSSASTIHRASAQLSIRFFTSLSTFP